MILMTKTIALIISIAIVAVLIVVFFVSYVHNKRTPVPEGCEDLKINEDNCGACQVTDCSIKQKFDIEKLKEELEDEKEDK